MGAYKYIQQAFQKEASSRSAEYKSRLIKMRREPVIKRLAKPTNVARARTLGYKAKQGFAVARVRVKRTKGMHTRPNTARRPKRMGTNKRARKKSRQVIGEERVAKRFPNMEVLNSYWIADDGQSKWFEVILLDPNHPSIKNDKDVNWITSKKHTNRALRGKTSVAKKGRGQRSKGKGTEKNRPSIRANKRQGK